jgi:hypothetical protein
MSTFHLVVYTPPSVFLLLVVLYNIKSYEKQTGQSVHPTPTPIGLPVITSFQNQIRLSSHADALLLDLLPNLAAWFKLHSNSTNTPRSYPAIVPFPSSTHSTASLPVHLWLRQDSL